MALRRKPICVIPSVHLLPLKENKKDKLFFAVAAARVIVSSSSSVAFRLQSVTARYGHTERLFMAVVPTLPPALGRSPLKLLPLRQYESGMIGKRLE